MKMFSSYFIFLPERSKGSGFSLLEVIVALVLMAIALTAIFQNQGGNLRAALRSERTAQAMHLAQSKMTEIEIEMRKKNFEAMREEESGEFKDEKLANFRWEKRLEKVDLSCFFPNNKEETNTEEQGIFSLATKIFEQAVRKAVVQVFWEEAGKERSAKLSQLLVRFEDVKTSF